jgi:hypothetical protein
MRKRGFGQCRERPPKAFEAYLRLARQRRHWQPRERGSESLGIFSRGRTFKESFRWWTGSLEAAVRQPQRPLAAPRGSLDMRRRLPGHLASLAALLRSMPTAHGQGSNALARREADDLRNQVPTHFSSAELACASIGHPCFLRRLHSCPTRGRPRSRVYRHA